jgi:hypothetical protein
MPLDEVIIALQKAFSRVSDKSSAVPDSRALVMGPVSFQMKLRVEAEAPDQLVHSKTGSIELNLDGKIEPDIRIQEEDPSKDTNKEPS